MSALRSERRAVALLFGMTVTGMALLAIPFFLTPPAYLEIALRDVAFGADLSRQQVTITEGQSGKITAARIERLGNAFVARVGRIKSGAATYTARVTGYKAGAARVNVAALQHVRVPVDLTPEFGRLEISPVDATHADDPVPAIVKNGSRTVTDVPQRLIVVDLPPGAHRLSASAAGYCETVREFQVEEGKVTKAAFPLSPDLKDDEIARFILGWRREPADLDTHFWKSDSTRFPSAKTVYFKNKIGVMPGGATFARLDVDELYPGGYETLTVRDAAAGEFRYFIHVYAGRGTIADANPTVQVYTHGCQARTFTPPPDCAYRIWDVARLRHGTGELQLEDLQHCQPEGSLTVRKAS